MRPKTYDCKLIHDEKGYALKIYLGAQDEEDAWKKVERIIERANEALNHPQEKAH